MPDEIPINATYASSPTSLKHLPYILSSLNSQFPLRNLHWKSATRPSVKTIQECDVKLHKLSEAQTKSEQWKLPAAVQAGSLVRGCLVHICFVECEDNEVYKSSTKPYISSWLGSLPPAQHSHAQNLIVLVNTATPANGQGAELGKAAGSMFNNLRSAATGSTASALLSKLKSDFGHVSTTTDKPGSSSTNLASTLDSPVTRVISLPLPSQPPTVQHTVVPDPSLFVDVVQSLKDSILGSLDDIVREREETVRRGEAAMRVPGGGTGGWNWNRFFAAKESLAITYEKLGLWEDAIIIYDELEASMVQVQRDNSTFIGKIGAENIVSGRMPLSTTSYPLPSPGYTIYDYHIYLFRRQIEMLSKSLDMGIGSAGGKSVPIEIVERGLKWVVGMGRWLRENAPANLNDTIEAFIYDAVEDIDHICQDIQARIYTDAALAKEQTLLLELKAFLAGRGSILGIGILQMDRLGIKNGILPPTYPFNQSVQLLPQTDSILFDVPASPVVPDSVSTPRGTVQPIRQERQLLNIVRKQEKFYSLYKANLEKARIAENGSGRIRIRLYLEEKTAELAYYVNDLESASQAFFELCQDYLSDEARQVGATGSPWAAIRLRALSRAIECRGRLDTTVDKVYIMLLLEYLSLISSSADSFEGEERRQEDSDTVKRILTAIEQFNATVQDQELDILEHPLFRVSLASVNARTLETEDGSEISLIVENSAPASIEVDDVRICLMGRNVDQLWFSSGCQILAEGFNEIQLTSPMPAEGIFQMESTRITKGHLSFEYRHDSETTDLRSRMLKIPHDHSGFNASLQVPHDVSLEAESRLELCLSPGRNDCRDASINLMSENEAVTFHYANTLIGGDKSFQPSTQGIIIQDLSTDSRTMLSIPYSSDTRAEELTLRINIDYRTKLQPAIKRQFRQSQWLDLSLPLAVNVQDFFRPDCLISKFTVSTANQGDIRVRSASVTSENTGLAILPFTKTEKTISVTSNTPLPYVFKISQDLNRQTQQEKLLKLVLTYQLATDNAADSWRTLSIPVEIPSMDVISQSRLEIAQKSGRVGEPIAVKVQIRTSSAWATSAPNGQTMMLYDVIADKEGWLVGGPKRGTYPADEDTPFETEILLIPLRHGLLPYPAIVTQPISAGGRQPTFENYQEDTAGVINIQPSATQENGVVHVLRELGTARDSWGSGRAVAISG